MVRSRSSEERYVRQRPLLSVLRSGLRVHRAQVARLVRRVPWVGPFAVDVVRRARSMRRTRTGFRAERFERLIAERYGTADIETIPDPVRRLHADFALTTVSRGVWARDRIATHTTIEGKRYLDVGCAYGGFLVAFAQAGAERVVGIDVSERFLACARALLEDYGVDAQVQCLDVLRADGANLGQFDIVTCNDVIEHVRDPAATLNRLVDLLDDGGTLFMQIPNRHSASFVLSDGHYRKFGLTALPKHAADRYFNELTSKRHDVTYKSLPFYLNGLARAGASAEIINPRPWQLAGQLTAIAETFDACESRLSLPIPEASPETRASLDRHVRRLATHYRRQLDRYQALCKRDAAAARELGMRMWLYFGCDFWDIVATKQPS